MKKTMIMIFLLTVAITLLTAQEVEPFEPEMEQTREIQDSTETKVSQGYKYQRKSALTAMLLSSIFPGSGQFYANPHSITAYVFPVVEIALWAGYIIYQGKGTDKEDEYMKYATDETVTVGNSTGPRYSRLYQEMVESDLTMQYPNDIYDESHFRLDDNNTQHFYEDIGKYDKYIFGWCDWYDIYAAHGIDWAWFFDDPDDTDPKSWIGNYPTKPGEDTTEYDAPYSAMRSEYNDMRREAEDLYQTADMLTFGLVFNHIISSLDALRVTRQYNSEYISQAPYKMRVKTAMVNKNITPVLTLSYKF
ncbi:MAG: hypothetical protein K8S56_10720 [Candidatus Cloacimonetes bacterium]|nr:hypothetical protein [Candidatus Cloacimonadota bacterium]